MLDVSHASLRFSLSPEAPFNAPAFDGSMLRGAFGHALRRLVCIMRRRDCGGCPLTQGCVYHRIFETQPAPDRASRIAKPPHPYVLGANLRPRAGEIVERLDFAIRLFGRAIADAPFVVRAIEEASARGLGRERVPFSLARVESGGAPCDARAGYPVPAPEAPPPALPERVRVKLATPLRLFRDGRPLDHTRLDGPAFGQAILRRASLLSAFHGEGRGLDRPTLQAEAARLRLVEPALGWRRLQRHSSRQKARQAIGGVVGEVTVDFAEAPALRDLARWLPVMHLGKGTSMGLGRIEVLGHG